MTVSVDHAIEVLNRALEADRAAISALFETRSLVREEALIDDPTIQVGPHEDLVRQGNLGLQRTRWLLGPLGIINGIFGIREDGYGHITMDVNDNTGMIERFYRTDEWKD